MERKRVLEGRMYKMKLKARKLLIRLRVRGVGRDQVNGGARLDYRGRVKA